ncbi:efflux RND transporter permease subunit [Bacteroides sp. 519]|uniref:efflux RND transporter permease subunit n=1 Tax=Bacteroides sp. 519 TaxID=2302937 RepID=UPI0013D51978|nr:efflux RND transporter permease subunit [Bacteroides sp. 519]NDV56578.1 efflux RND transporter permease subunit [Bacteroides sp. 519]
MKKIVNFAVSNPVTVSMIILAILLLGKISYDRLSVDLLPDLNNPKLFVEIKAGERPPEEIEKLYIKNMEAMAIRQTDVTQVSSVIKAGSARITVEYTWTKDMDQAYLDLQKAMNPFSQTDGLEELRITQHDPNTAPVVLIGFSHQTITDMAELRKVAESYVRNELIRLEGVAEVTLSGTEQTSLFIRTDPYRLEAFGLTIDEIAQRIEANNQTISGGRVSEMGIQYLVKSVSQFGAPNDFENLIVGYKTVDALTNAAGQQDPSAVRAPVYLREVANIQFENDRPENIVRINGERSLGLSVYKEMRFNTVKVVDGINRQLTVMENALPGYRFQVITNQGLFIKSAISEVKDSAILGIILAIIVLFVFLRRIGTTLIVSLAIPISIVATFNLMFFTGLTLNIMTLGGLALGAGMLVDNAIVVIESIFRNHRRGLSIKDAAITGTSEVGGAIIASTLTTIVVFLPIVYLHGATGELFKDQAWTVTFSLLSSLFVAILLIPMLYLKLSGKKKTFTEDKSLEIKGYDNLLRIFLRHRWMVIGIGVLMIVIAAACLPFIGTEYMPQAESKSFTVQVKLPEGTRLERTAAAVATLEELVYDISADSLATIYTHVGPGGNSANAIFEGENTATMKVMLSGKAALNTDDVITRFVESAQSPGTMEITIAREENSLSSLLGSDEAPLVVEVKGEELEEIARITALVKERMLTVPGVFNVVTSIEDGAPEIIVSVDRTVAGINNLSVATVIEQLKQQLSGRTTGKMEYRGEMREILIRMPDINLATLGEVVIKNGDQRFRLREIAELKYSQAPKEILRRNQARISKVMAGIDSHTSLDKAAREVRAATNDIEVQPNYSITVAGDEEKRQESMHSLVLALVLSIILVYMVLASQFESLLHPFTILLTIPLAVVGAILLFFITGSTLNIMGVIGMVMLVGIAVNNSIILVDRINQIKDSGTELTEAIVQAGKQRIRPIIMTSLTTILALLPMTFSFGEGASLRSPMAIAVVGGLVTSTLMSLAVIPCVYYLFENAKQNLKRKRNELPSA